MGKLGVLLNLEILLCKAFKCSCVLRYLPCHNCRVSWKHQCIFAQYLMRNSQWHPCSQSLKWRQARVYLPPRGSALSPDHRRLSACSDIAILMCWLPRLMCVHTGLLFTAVLDPSQGMAPTEAQFDVFTWILMCSGLKKAFVLCTRSLWLNTFECIYRLCSHDLL